MGVETATTIDELNEAWPLDTDPFREGAEHLRLLKTVLKASWTGARPVKIALLADSLGGLPATGIGLGQALEAELREGGLAAEVITFGTSGFTYYKAITDILADGKTAQEAVIDYAPDVVCVCLGANDTVLARTRTYAQIQSDASALFSALRAALPNAAIVQLKELMYEATQFDPAVTLLNKGAIPYLHALRTTGAWASCRTKEILEDSVSSTNKSYLVDWLNLVTYVDGLTEVDASATLDIYKVARLGLTIDGVHPTLAGTYMLAMMLYEFFRTNTAVQTRVPAFAKLRSVAQAGYNTFSALWATGYTLSGNSWVVSALDAELGRVLQYYGLQWGVLEDSWYRRYRASWTLSRKDYTASVPEQNIFTWAISNAPQNATVYFRIWSGTEPTGWTAASGLVQAGGTLIGSGPMSLLTPSPGTYQLKMALNVDGIYDVFGPVTITMSA